MDRRSALKGLCGLGAVAAVPGVVSAATADVSCRVPDALVLANEEIVRIIGRFDREPGEPHARAEWRSRDMTTPGNRSLSIGELNAWFRMVAQEVQELATHSRLSIPFTIFHNSASGTDCRELRCDGCTDAQAASRIIECAKFIVAYRNTEWKRLQRFCDEPLGYAFNWTCDVQKAIDDAGVNEFERHGSIQLKNVHFFIGERGGPCTLREIAPLLDGLDKSYRRTAEVA